MTHFNIQQAMHIDTAQTQDRDALLEIAARTGVFTPEAAEGLLGSVLDELASDRLPTGHQAAACRLRAGGTLIGWTYFAPDQYAEGVWNLWWIGVDPEHQGLGAGLHLLRHAERVVSSKGGRVLVIETSDAPALARARRFYEAQGYRACGRIPDFYSEGESKVIFARRPREE